MDDEMKCPLPVVRQGYDDDDTEWTRLEICGEPLAVVSTGSGSIVKEGGVYLGSADDVTQWRIECMQGHVLLIPDIEDRSMTWAECGDQWLPALASITWDPQ